MPKLPSISLAPPSVFRLELARPTVVGIRAPLIHLLLPLIFGYLWARNWGNAESLPFLLTGLAASVIALALSLTAQGLDRASGITLTKVIWHTSVTVSVLCLAAGYFFIRWDFPDSDWRHLPPREVTLELKAERIFNTNPKYPHAAGVARIIDAPEHLNELLGQQLVYRLLPIGNAEAPMRSGTFKTRAVLYYFDHELAQNDFEYSMVDQGVYFRLSRGIIFDNTSKGNTWRLTLHRIHEWSQQTLSIGSEHAAAEANVAKAMLLGHRSALSEEQKSLFRASGTMHLFAVSGLHVGIVGSILFIILRIVRVPRVGCHLAMLLMLFAYVQVIGATPSASRAYIMVLCLSLARLVQRKNDYFPILAISALIVLIYQPSQLWSVGFQLSYAVVAAIILYGMPLLRVLDQAYEAFPGVPRKLTTKRMDAYRSIVRNVGGSLIISASAVLGSFPLIVHYFGLLTPGAVLLNLLLVPMATLSLASNLLSLLSGALRLEFLSYFFNRSAYFINFEMEMLIAWVCSTPGLFMERTYISSYLGPLTLAAILLSCLLLPRQRFIQAPFIWLLPPALLIFSFLFTR